MLSLRQSRFTQAHPEKIGISAALEGRNRRSPVDCVRRLNSQHLGCLWPSLLQSPKLRIGGSQPTVAGLEVWGSGDTLSEWRERFGTPRQIERETPHSLFSAACRWNRELHGELLTLYL
jgi:hypothetical protein